MPAMKIHFHTFPMFVYKTWVQVIDRTRYCQMASVIDELKSNQDGQKSLTISKLNNVYFQVHFPEQFSAFPSGRSILHYDAYWRILGSS